MKSSVEIKNLKFSLGKLKINIEIGWIFSLILLILSLSFVITRLGFIGNIQDQYENVCTIKQARNLEVDNRLNTPLENRVNMFDICMLSKKSTIELMLDTSIWEFKEAYPDIMIIK